MAMSDTEVTYSVDKADWGMGLLWVRTRWQDGVSIDSLVADVIIDAANRHLCKNGGETTVGLPIWNINHRDNLDTHNGKRC